METNKNNKKIKALKVFGLFMIIVILMNILMTYMVAKHSSGKELDALKKEIESLKYELKVAKEENEVLMTRLDNVDINKGESDEKVVTSVASKAWNNAKSTKNSYAKKNVTKTVASKTVKTMNKIKKEKEFDINAVQDIKHIEFPAMTYKDVEYDIISGRIKIPEVKSEYKEEIDKKVEEARYMDSKYAKYDIIINKAKSYGRDVSYLDYEFLDYVWEEADRFNVNPYVILAIVSGESNFYAQAKNKNSSATGLGQIVKGTGEYIHYNVLGYTNDYNHNIQKDPKVNIKYMLGYFKYLKKYDSYDRAMGEYCGSKTYYASTYRNKLLNNMVALGLTKSEANSILKGQIV